VAATAASYVVVTIDSTDALSVLYPDIAPTPPALRTGRRGMMAIAKYLEEMATGSSTQAGRVSIIVQSTTGWTAATGTVSCVVASAPSDGDTCVIAGVTFTFKTTPAVSDPTQVAIGADGSASMTNLNAAVAANTWLTAFMGAGVITGTTTKTITWTAVQKGAWANSIAITKSGSALSVASFSGGTNGTTTSAGTGVSVYNRGM
jgi:hypothetical protein